MFAKPQEEHHWLQQLVGRWRVEQQCMMPDGKTTGSDSEMNCRMVGGLWLIAENSGKSDEGDEWTCVMTLGFDPQQEAYIGTFLGSMMTHLWQYKGQVDLSGKRLPLESEGPTVDGTGTTRYFDIVEILSADQWNFTGEMLGEDGTWTQIMKTQHYRIK